VKHTPTAKKASVTKTYTIFQATDSGGIRIGANAMNAATTAKQP
jgi:hypothetical protein